MTADDTSQDVAGQTKQVLDKIDAALETHGTDKTRLLQAQVWVKDIRDRDAMNTIWTAWLPEGGAPVRACVEASHGRPAVAGRDHGHGLQVSHPLRNGTARLIGAVPSRARD